MVEDTNSEVQPAASIDPDPVAEPTYDVETYRHALQEARRTLDHQLKAFNDVNDKAWRIVQFNGIIATVYIAAVANAIGSLTLEPIPVGVIVAGLVSIGASAFLAAEGQKATKVTIGQSTDAFESLRENDPSEIAYLYKTLEDYEDWIDEVNEKTESNGSMINTAKWLMIIGVVLITSGTVLVIEL